MKRSHFDSYIFNTFSYMRIKKKKSNFFSHIFFLQLYDKGLSQQYKVIHIKERKKMKKVLYPHFYLFLFKIYLLFLYFNKNFRFVMYFIRGIEKYLKKKIN